MMQAKVGAIAWSFRREIGVIVGVLVGLIIFPMIVIIELLTGNAQGATNNPGATLYTGAASTQNTYAYGYCTFWADKRREDIGKPIPNNWGDAHTWVIRALVAKYTVDHTPSVGAIMQTTAGDLGHVAFVESITPDGGWTVSEMNAPQWDVVSSRTFKASIAATYNFIH